MSSGRTALEFLSLDAWKTLPFPLLGAMQHEIQCLDWLILYNHSITKLWTTFFLYQDRRRQWQSLGSWEETSGRAAAMCHFGAAAWKTTNGSREAHKYTETSSEEQNRWGGALTYNFVPHLTSLVNRQQQHLDSHLSNLHKCLTLHPGLWTNSEQWTDTKDEILTSLCSRGLCHRFKWDQDFCSILFS